MQFHKVRIQLDATGHGQVFIDEEKLNRVTAVTLFARADELTEVEIKLYAHVDIEADVEGSKILSERSKTMEEQQKQIDDVSAVEQARKQRLEQWKPVETDLTDDEWRLKNMYASQEQQKNKDKVEPPLTSTSTDKMGEDGEQRDFKHIVDDESGIEEEVLTGRSSLPPEGQIKKPEIYPRWLEGSSYIPLKERP